MPISHRNSDPRVCGAATVVVGQDFVTINGQLWAVDGDPNSHGGGPLSPSQSFVTIGGKLVIVHAPDAAAPDALCLIVGPPHCSPDTGGGDDTVTVEG